MTPRERAIAAAAALPDRLKAARKLAGLTQDEVVTVAEFAPVTISKIETGNNLPTFDILVRLAYALDVSPNSLIGWGDAGQPGGPAERRALINQLALLAERLPEKWLEELVRIAKLAAE